jgi:hypothetical protein
MLVVIVYAAYTGTRGLLNGDIGSADSTGHTLLRWERSAHLAPEHALNQLAGHLPALAVAASYFYATLHYVVTPVVLVWMYRRHPGGYRAARTTLLATTVIGLAGFWLLPTTPPRLLPGGGFQDTLAAVSGWGWWGGQASAPRGLGGLTNQYAAMPSLHVGWALWSGWLLARHARRRSVRAAGRLYPVLTVLVVMATANHYLLDAVAGIAILALAAGIVAFIPRQARLVRETLRRAVGRAMGDERRIPRVPSQNERRTAHPGCALSSGRNDQPWCGVPAGAPGLRRPLARLSDAGGRGG